jgi:hypothetical protein
MFDQGLWAPIAILVAVGFVVMAVVAIKWLRDQRVIPSSPEEEEDMAHLPMTTLQRRAWWALAFGLALDIAIVVLIARVGVVAYSNDDSLRSVVVVLVFLSLAVYLGMLLPTALQVGRSGVDERDQKVLTTAPSVQAGAMMITTVAWTIYLTEEFRGIGIPTEYMYPLAGSVFLVFMLAHSVGILIGYWLSRRHAQS